MTIPIVLQNFITMGVNLIDTLMIGKLGETALSASSLATQFVGIFQSFCMGVSMGASVLASRFWGMQELPSMRKAITIMLRISLVLSVLFTVVTYVAPEQIMRIFTDDDTIIRVGTQYLKYAAWSYIFHGISLNCTIMLRCVRKVHLPLIASIVAFVFNVGGNYVLIFGHLGFPEMGIAGASLATLISRIFEFIVIFGYFMFIDKSIGYRPRHIFTKVADLLPEYIKISIPVLISDGLMAFGNSAVAMVIGRMGESFIAANAIVAVVTRLLNIFSSGVSQASAVIVGNTLGEGHIDDVQDQGYAFFGLGAVLGLIVAGMVFASVPIVNAVYNLSGQTAETMRWLMLAVSIVVVFESTNGIITKGVLRAGGDTKVLMIGDCIFLWCASVPLGYLAGLVWHMPAFWVYFFLKIEAILKCVWCFMRLRSGKWIKRVSRNEIAFESSAEGQNIS